MLDVSTIVLLLGATVTLNLSPGPEVLYVLANSARHGTRGELYATLGISCGVTVHTVIAAAGIAALLATHR